MNCMWGPKGSESRVLRGQKVVSKGARRRDLMGPKEWGPKGPESRVLRGQKVGCTGAGRRLGQNKDVSSFHPFNQSEHNCILPPQPQKGLPKKLCVDPG